MTMGGIDSAKVGGMAPAGHEALLTTDCNLLEPDTLIMFFESKIKDCRGTLNRLMAEQDLRSKRGAAIEKFAAALAKYSGRNIGPQEGAEYEKLKQEANDALKELGPDSDEGKKIQAFLAKASGDDPNALSKPFDINDKTGIEQYQKNHPGAEVVPEKLGADGKVATVVLKGGKGVGGAYDMKDIDALKGEMSAAGQSLRADAQMSMIRVQQQIDIVTQHTNACTNILRKVDEMSMAPIHNLK